MEKINSYKDLIVWQKAIDLSVEVYQVTMYFPSEEIYGLTNQIRRACNSISLNIAEGHSRNSTKSYINSLNIANGSLHELESGIYLSQRLNFIDVNSTVKTNELVIEIQKMLSSLITKLTNKINP